MSDQISREDVHRLIGQRFAFLRKVVLVALSERLSSTEVSHQGYQLLFQLKVCDGMSQKELSASQDLDPGGISRLVAKMNKAGLLRTETDPKDRRRQLVHLTDEGRRVEAEVAPLVDEIVEEHTGGLDEEEERLMLRLLDKAVAHVEQLLRCSKKAEQ